MRYFRLLLLSLFITVLSVVGVKAQWVNTHGPYNPGVVTGLVVSGSAIIAGDAETGVFLSSDNGTSWTPINNGLTSPYIHSLTASGGTILAGTNGGEGVYLSTDNGASWTASNHYSNGLNSVDIQCAAIDGNNIFAGTGTGAYISKDNDTSWTAVSNGLPTNIPVLALAASGGRIFAGTLGGGAIYSSTDNGANWTASNYGLSDSVVRAFAVSGGVMFAGTEEAGVYRSTDGGGSWTAVNNGLTKLQVSSLAVNGGNIFAGTIGAGVYYSPDDGSHWIEIDQGQITAGDRVSSLAFSDSDIFAGAYSGVWRRPLSELTASASQNNSAYFDGNARIRVVDGSPANPNANQSAYQISGTAVTMEAWIFPMSVPTGANSEYIMARPANTGFGVDPYQTFALMIVGDAPFSRQPRIGISITDGTHPSGTGYEVFVEDTSAVKLGQWTHVAGTYDGTNVKLYINGALVHQLPLNVAMGSGSTGLYIGGAAGGYFSGIIDEVRLWNVARTQSEIQSKMDSTLLGNEAGLAGYWPMDTTYAAANGLATVDKSNNHNDLYLQYDAALVPYPQGTAPRIPATAPKVSTLYAVANEQYEGPISSLGWPKPSFSIVQGPSGMSIVGDTLYWTPTEAQSGYSQIILSAANGVNTALDTAEVFTEILRSLQNKIRVDFTNRGKLAAMGWFNKGLWYNGQNGLFAGDFSLVDRKDVKFAGGLETSNLSFAPAEGFTSVPSRFPGFTAMRTSFTDAWEPNRIGVHVYETVYSSTAPGNDKYAIFEFKMVNTSGSPLQDLFAQLTNDFDVGFYGDDLGGYDPGSQLSYAYEPGGTNDKSYYGFSLLNETTSGEVVWSQYTISDTAYVRSTTHLTQDIAPPSATGDIRNQLSSGPFALSAGDTLTVAFAVMAGDNLADIQQSAARARSVYTATSWEIQLKASVGSCSSSGNYLGTGGLATEGYDPGIDYPEPPVPPSNYVYLFFPHPEWSSILGPNFMTDVRHDTDLTSMAKAWTFTVATDHKNKIMTITPVLGDSVPKSYPMVLKDLRTGAATDIRATPTYSYNTGTDSSRSFQVIVGTPRTSINHTYSAGWNMVGVPIRADSSLKAPVFGSSSYAYGYSSIGYFTADTLQLGEGYWLGSTTSVNAAVKGVQVLGMASMSLQPGFNMISTPFLESSYPKIGLSVKRGNTTVSLDSAASLSWVSRSLYSYNSPTGSYVAADTLSAWKGYWFAALDSNLALVFNPPVDTVVHAVANKQAVSGNKSVAVVSSADWGLRLCLSVGKVTDQLGELGIKTDAKSGFDARYDLPHPPSPPSTGQGYAYLTFPHPEWANLVGPDFSTYFQNPSSVSPWNIMVGYTGGKATGLLTWDPKGIPSGVSILLTDLGNGGSPVEMEKTASYEFMLNGKDSLVVSATLTTVGKEGPSVPATYALYQNYPNPFNPSTTITFDLKETSSVRLEVYNVLGQRVLDQEYGTLSGGEYSRNISLSSCASGVYFYRLTADGSNGDHFFAIKKMLLMK